MIVGSPDLPRRNDRLKPSWKAGPEGGSPGVMNTKLLRTHRPERRTPDYLCQREATTKAK